MGVIEYYQGKYVLLTGTTGFIGKVCLEKFLRVLPNVGRLYIMIRKKKGLNTMERFKKEILGSKCFDRVRKLNPHFDEMINEKIRPVEGDLLKPGLGLSPEDFKELTENLHVIINCAASIDFNSRLDEAIEMNVYGTLKMFDLAKATKNLESFLHVSTAYVNSDKQGLIEEKIYEENIDAEKLINDIYKMPKDQLIQETPRIVGKFPNTYTFTKSMVERILQKKRGDMSLTLLRPSIVGTAWRDPSIGWIDTVTAASGVFLLGGLGIMKYLEGDPSLISDQMPVDYVADAMIVAAATFANQKQLTVVHSTSSSRNPLNGGFSFNEVKSYWRAHPPEKRVGPCTIHVIKNPTLVKLHKLGMTVPTDVYHKVAYTVGSSSMRKNADKLKKMVIRTQTMCDLFRSFSTVEWIYMTYKIDEMKKFCTPQELKEFQLDIADVDWKKYFQYFAWGLHHYVIGENVDHPTNDSGHMDLLESFKGSTYIDDIKWAYNNGYEFKTRPKAQMKSMLLNSPRLQNIIKDLVLNRKNKNISEEKFTQQLMQKSSQMCDRMMSTYNMKAMRIASWVAHVFTRHMFEKIVVDENFLNKLAQIDTKTKGPLVFLPSHRSFADFILISYIFFAHKMKVPHVGAYEEFLRMALLPRIIRASGAFFMKKDKFEFKELYDAILAEYLQRLMLDESSLELFLEGTRSRYGKALPPNNALLGMVTDTFYEKKVPDIQLVPVTLNYERVVEGDTFPEELLGEEPLKLSTRKMMMSYRKLSKNFGKVFIKFAEPISLKEYTQNFSNLSNQGLLKDQIVPQPTQQAIATKFDPFKIKEDRTRLVNQLGFDLIRIINDTLVIMPTSLVASILLLRRKGISEEGIIKKVDWLIHEILLRGGKLSTNFPHVAVKSALSHLDDLLERKKDVFHPSFSAKSDYKNILLLSYYRNMLGHIFFNEAIIAAALAAFGYELAWKDGVSVERLWESTSYLQKLIGNEYFTWKKLNKENFNTLLAQMIERGTFTLEDQKIKVSSKGNELMQYLCSLVWPFIEGYWVTAVFMFTLKNRDSEISLEKFELELQGFAESMYDERTVQFYEACSIDTIRNALHAFKDLGVISVETKFHEESKSEIEVLKLQVSEAQLKEIVDNTNKYMKNSLANTMDMPVDIARRAVLIDFPFMSKL